MDFFSPALFAHIVIGLMNGAFYSMLAMGLAIIFGLMNIANFAHGAQYMLGAMVAWILLSTFGIGYWESLVLAPLIVGVGSMAFEYFVLRRIYNLDHLYGLLLTFGAALIVQGLLHEAYGSTPQRYDGPSQLAGGINLGFMYFPTYRAWIILVSAVCCIAAWFTFEKTPVGSWLRAAVQNKQLVRAFGIRIPRMFTIVYGTCAALAALTGVLAAPIYQVSPIMGNEIIVVIFAIVVIGGMGSLFGAVVSGFMIGVLEGLTTYIYPPASNLIVFIVMALVILWRPTGLFGREAPLVHVDESATPIVEERSLPRLLLLALFVLSIAAPFLIYPIYAMKILYLGLFACSFALLLGHLGLLSFGHAAFFGSAVYTTGYLLREVGLSTELSVLAGVVVSVFFGVIFGYISVRRRGIYFAMITMALAQTLYFYVLKADWTGGDDGMTLIPRGKLFGLISLEGNYALYVFVLAMFWAGFFVFYRTLRSPFGHVLRMIRDNEPRAVSLGYNVFAYRLAAFTISAGLAGLAGALKTIVFQLGSVTDIHWMNSGEVVLIALLGGVNTIVGPVVGAATLVGVESYFTEGGSGINLAKGVLFVACVLLFRQGIYGQILAWLSAYRKAPASLAPRGPNGEVSGRASAETS